MAWPATSYWATYDHTSSSTLKPNVDSVLWKALQAKSPILDMVSRYPIDNFTFSWETANAPTRIFTEASSGSTTMDSSTSGTALVVTDSTGLETGSIIRNATRATPIGTYNTDELMEVTAISTNTLTIVRDVARQNSGTGSAVHALADTFELVYTPKEEGSSAGVNRYKDVSLVSNYANLVDLNLNATGDQLATAKMVGADNMQTQFENALQNLQNQIEGMLLYGALNNGANAGSDSYVRRTKGLDNFICASGGNVDYTTCDVTEDALNALFQTIVTNNTDPSDPFVIVCHPQNARKISALGADKVRVGQELTKWGRYVDTFRSDLGIDAPVIWSMNCTKSDLFILDMKKIALAVFRPFAKYVIGPEQDLVDAERTRYMGSIGVKCVNGLYSHGKLGKISW